MTTISKELDDGNDDAYQADSGGSYSRTDHRLLYRADNAAGSRFNSGTRWEDFTIPFNSDVNWAYQDVYCQTTAADDIHVDFYCHNVGNSPEFPASSGADDISDRKSDLTTGISEAADAVGTGYRNTGANPPWESPDIGKAFDDVVKRGDWVSGNAITCLILGKTQASHKRFEGHALEHSGGTDHALIDLDYTAPPPIFSELMDATTRDMQDQHQVEVVGY